MAAAGIIDVDICPCRDVCNGLGRPPLSVQRARLILIVEELLGMEPHMATEVGEECMQLSFSMFLQHQVPTAIMYPHWPNLSNNFHDVAGSIFKYDRHRLTITRNRFYLEWLSNKVVHWSRCDVKLIAGYGKFHFELLSRSSAFWNGSTQGSGTRGVFPMITSVWDYCVDSWFRRVANITG